MIPWTTKFRPQDRGERWTVVLLLAAFGVWVAGAIFVALAMLLSLFLKAVV